MGSGGEGKRDGGRMIPILDLKVQYESIKDEINAAIAEVLESTQFILGPVVRDLEQAWTDHRRRILRSGRRFGCDGISGSQGLMRERVVGAAR
ncbi:MAG: DegT/DnrJ/EryC1/StrS aminotransferase family protein [Anaerolineales bacterium]|nr:DegT/DnrJ/EryC1/StrS aminotransferase family protein [Anaerolineales bacterium]